MLSLSKLSSGGVLVLLASLLQTLSAQGASVRHHRLRGGEHAGFLAPSSDMMKALEYIENLKQRANGPENPTGDYDEVDKFRFLVQLASLQDENAPNREDAARWPDNKMPQWVQSLLRMLEHAGESADAPAAVTERRLHKSRRPVVNTGSPAAAAGDYGGFVKPHKKYPLMFEDEENDRDKRATEDLDEQYTPQSLANMRSIFEELGKLSAAQNQKRENQEDEDGEDDDDDLYRVRNLAYEDVTGGEEWVPLEEQMETEEVVKGNHEEYKRGLLDNSEPGETTERRASSTDEDDPDDDTKLVDYYLLKVLEMTDQAQKRDLMEGRRRLLSRPSLIDPRAIKQLLSALSVKLQVPPEDLVGMLFMEETRKQQRLPETPLARNPSQPQYKSRVIKYYNGRQPEVTVSNIPANVKTEDILKILGLGNQNANKNAKFSFLKQRPYKTAISKYFNPNGRRGSLFLSELNKAPSKRKDDYDDDDAVDEDEESTFLAAKMLTEYPDPSDRKRSIDSPANGQLPYELYEEAMKDFFDQADGGKSAPVKRDTQGKEDAEAPQKPPAHDSALEPPEQTPPAPGTEEDKEFVKTAAGM